MRKILMKRWLTLDFATTIRYTHIIHSILSIKHKQGFSILDVGAGPGFLAEELRMKGFDIVVSDINPQQMKEVKSLLKVESIVLDAAHLCFKDKAFDIVISSDVYEHLDEFIDWYKEHNVKSFSDIRKVKDLLSDSYRYEVKPYQGILALSLYAMLIKLKLPSAFKFLFNSLFYLVFLYLDKLPPFYSFLFTVNLE